MSDFEDDFIPDEVQDGAEEADDFMPDDDAGSGRPSRVMQLPETRIEGAVDRSVAPRRSVFERIGDVFAPGEANAQPLRGRLEEVFLPTPSAPMSGHDRRGDAMATGAVHGATLGFADELAGAVRAGLRGEPGAYAQERDRMRRVTRETSAQAPEQYMAGEVVGGLAPMVVPGGGAVSGATRGARLLRAGAIAGGYGTAEGLGRSEADSVGGQALDALQGGATGAALGSGGAALAEGVGAGARALQGFLRSRAPRMQQAADEARVLTAMGATGGSINKPGVLQDASRMRERIAGVAEWMRNRGMGGPRSVVGIRERSGRIAEQSRDAIDDVINVHGASETVDPAEFARLLREEADGMARQPELNDVAAALRRRAEEYDAIAGAPYSLAEAQQAVSRMGNQGGWARELPSTAQEASQASTRAMRRLMDDAVDRAYQRSEAAASGVYRTGAGAAPGGVTAAQYRQLRRDNDIARTLNRHAEESVQRARKNRFFGLMDAETIQAAGGGVRGAGVALGRRAILGRGAAMRASTLEAFARLARTSPDKFGRWAPRVEDAARRGGRALALLHDELSAEPEFMAALETGEQR